MKLTALSWNRVFTQFQQGVDEAVRKGSIFCRIYQPSSEEINASKIANAVAAAPSVRGGGATSGRGGAVSVSAASVRLRLRMFLLVVVVVVVGALLRPPQRIRPRPQPRLSLRVVAVVALPCLFPPLSPLAHPLTLSRRRINPKSVQPVNQYRLLQREPHCPISSSEKILPIRT